MDASELLQLKGIGPKRAGALNRLGIFTISDLLSHIPIRYLDYSTCTPVGSLTHGTDAAVRVRLCGEPRLAFARRGVSVLSVPAQDETGTIRLTFFNQPYRAKQFRAGETVIACGRVDAARGLKLVSPSVHDAPPGILPHYRLVSGLTQNVLRDAVQSALRNGPIEETLPEAFLCAHGLCSRETAVRNIHFPAGRQALLLAQRRINFEELLLYLIVLARIREKRRQTPGIAFQTKGVFKAFSETLPFLPTRAQRRAMEDVARDMAAPEQMNRLIQGDVGSGKTAVALFALYAAAENGYQAAFMAPTEILARQHFHTVCSVLKIPAVCISGSMKKSEREEALARVQTGEARLVIGTHALVQQGMTFQNLGLIVTDEQHRFGVRQRAMLEGKGKAPDMLIMSATPIPRTLSLVIYGDLELSFIDELPPGRKPVKTRYVPAEKRDAMYGFIARQMEAGRQAFIVCPQITEGEESLSCEAVFDELSNRQLKNARLGLLHGKLPAKQKQEVMDAFLSGALGALVATTVIEVGVDIPNAAVMAVEGADRFGLAQLHQLRGRVGRGGTESWFFMLSQSGSQAAVERMRILVSESNGARIAQKDLEMRGPGEFLGTQQHGDLMHGAFMGDMALVEEVRAAARRLLCDTGEGERLVRRAEEAARKRALSLIMN